MCIATTGNRKIRSCGTTSGHCTRAFRTIRNPDGFCIALHTSLQGTVVAAVPFRGAFDGELMVVNCAIAEFQADEEKLVKDIGPRLVGLVQQVERAQGSR